MASKNKKSTLDTLEIDKEITKLEAPMENEVKKYTTPVDFREISITGSQIYKTKGITDYNPDSLVGKKGLEIYRTMLIDDQVKAALTMKKYARLVTNWSITPASQDEGALEQAKFIKDQLDGLKGTFEDTLLNVLTALDYGFSVSEIVYKRIVKGRWEGLVGLRKIGTREPFYYNFDSDEHGNLRPKGLVYLGATFEYEPPNTTQIFPQSSDDEDSLRRGLPVQKFVIYSYNKQFANWYGTSDLRAAYRSFWSKEILIRFHNIYMERFGMPTHIAKYPKSMSKPDRDDLKSILDKVQAKYSIVIPEDIAIDLLNAASTTGYENAIEMHNRFIARSILIPDLMGYTVGGSAGSYALGQKHFDVFLWVLKKLGKDIEETIVGEQIIKRIIDINFPNVDRYPKFQFELLTEENAVAKAQIVQMGVGGGFINPMETWVRPYLGLPQVEKGVKLGVPFPLPGQAATGGVPRVEKPRISEGTPATKPTFAAFEEPEKEFIVSERFEKKNDKLFTALSRVVKKQKDKLIGAALNKRIIEDKKFDEIPKLQLRYVGDFRDSLIKAGISDKVAFSITGKEKDYILQKVKTALSDAMKANRSNDEVSSSLAYVFSNYIHSRLPEMLVGLPREKKSKKMEVEVREEKDLDRKKWDFFLGPQRNIGTKSVEKIIISQPTGDIIRLRSIVDRQKSDLGKLKALLIEKENQIINAKDGLNTSEIEFRFKEMDAIRNKARDQEVQLRRLKNELELEKIKHKNLLRKTKSAKLAEGEEIEGYDWVIKCPYTRCGSSEIKPIERTVGALIYQCQSCNHLFKALQEGDVYFYDIGKEEWVSGEFSSRPSYFTEQFTGVKYNIEVDEDSDLKGYDWVIKCPYTRCGSSEVKPIRALSGAFVYMCYDCNHLFKVLQEGDVYFYDIGKEEWTSSELYLRPSYFIEKTSGIRKYVEVNIKKNVKGYDWVIKCPYRSCGSSEVTAVNELPGAIVYLCKGCSHLFKALQEGDVYFYDSGKEEWVSGEFSIRPSYFVLDVVGEKYCFNHKQERDIKILEAKKFGLNTSIIKVYEEEVK